MYKQSGLFDHQNYVEKNKQKDSGYFNERNCIDKKHVEAKWIY